MPSRSTHVILKNQTAQTLFLTRADLSHGEWRHNHPPPATIAAGATGEWEAESHGLATGDEGHVQYAIGSKTSHDNVFLHFDNPYSGHNKYGLTTTAGYQAQRSGGPGNNADVTIVLSKAVRHDTGFKPSVHGFHFHNHWGNVPYSLPPLKGSILDKKYGNAKNGLCGGMVDAARDYFEAKHPIPPDTTPPLGEQDPLFVYLVRRLFDTFDIDDVSLYVKYMNPAYPDTDENVLATFGLADGRASVVINTEWPIIRDDINAGHPAPLGLVTLKNASPGAIGNCHQVLAYAYLQDGTGATIWVYDPNQPGRDDITIKFQTDDWSKPLHIAHNVDVTDEHNQRRPIYCLFRTPYKFHTPPARAQAGKAA